MTVSTQVSRNEYTGNGATTQYDFTFRILDKSHLLVQTLDTSESIVTLTLGTDYTVTGVNRYNGGKVVLTSALPVGYKISIERSTPVTQESSIRNQGGFFPEIHEDALDKLTMLVQQAYGWWSGLSLRKPSWLANYYDALNNRIRNLRDPSQAQDAATKSYVDSSDIDLQQQITSNFNHSLRVPDSHINQLPSAEDRAWKGLGFDGAGQPKLQDPAGTGLWGYVPAIGSFEQGSLLTQRFEVLLWESTDEYWRWDGVMPKVVVPGSTPATAGGTGKGKWIDVTDATLRANLGSGEGLLYIGSVPTIAHLSTISPAVAGQRIQVTEFDYGYIVGGGNFIVQHAADFIADGGKVVASGIAGLVFVREEYYTSRIVRPEWYGCRGRGPSKPDTTPFAAMLSHLNDGDYIKLMPNANHYNSFPNNSQSLDGWVISANKITFDGDGATLSRATPSSASYSGFTTLKLTGDEISLKGKLLITSEDPTNKPLYAYQSATKIDSREIFTSPLANTLGLWASGVDGLYIDKSVTLERAVFPFFSNNGTKNMKVFCTAKKSGQIYPQPTSESSDLALGSTFKLDACSDFIMEVIANDSAYAGIEAESNNVNGTITLVTNKAYHAGLHLWNRCKNITYKVSATDIVEGGGVIKGYGCEACSGDVTVYNAQYLVAYIGNSATTPVISCNAKGSGFNVTDGVIFFATAANNAYIQHCNVDVTVVHADVFSIGTGRQSAVKFNGGQYCDIKVNSKGFDYIFSLGMGANNKFSVAYNAFNTAFSYSDQRSFDNEYKYTDPGGNVYHLQAKASSHEYRSDAVTNPVLGFKPLLRKQINSDGFVNANLPITTTSVGGFYYDPDTKYVRVNL
ncbi:TPA: phage tail protein [Klebsiella pneumoniae]|nr:phage tail protein [Klebsiella pneumoniae]